MPDNYLGTGGTLGGARKQAVEAGVLALFAGTATATAGAATLNGRSLCIVTTESATTAALADYTLTLTNNMVAAGDVAFASVANGTNTGGDPVIGTTAVTAGQIVQTIRNAHASTAFNGTLVITLMIVKQEQAPL